MRMIPDECTHIHPLDNSVIEFQLNGEWCYIFS